MSGAAFTVIDRGRNVAPRAFDAAPARPADPAVQERLLALRGRAVGRDATGILELALHEEFAGRTAIVSSFGSESVVLLHMVAQIDPSTPILFLNTGKLFGETLRYRDRLQEQLGLMDVRSLSPDPRDRARLDPEGTLWSRDTDSCCEFRKVMPIKRALEPFAAQITGRKKFQTVARQTMQAVEFFDGLFRFNPLTEWVLEDLDTYVDAHTLPRHPLVEDGYPSIGCIPCTRRVQNGESYRAGRWSGLEKDECGIHGVDGEGI